LKIGGNGTYVKKITSARFKSVQIFYTGIERIFTVSCLLEASD